MSYSGVKLNPSPDYLVYAHVHMLLHEAIRVIPKSHAETELVSARAVLGVLNAVLLSQQEDARVTLIGLVLSFAQTKRAALVAAGSSEPAVELSDGRLVVISLVTQIIDLIPDTTEDKRLLGAKATLLTLRGSLRASDGSTNELAQLLLPFARAERDKLIAQAKKT